MKTDTQNPPPPSAASSPNPPAPFPGSAPLPDRTEAQRIIAEKAVETRRKRDRLPDPESARLIPASAAAAVAAAIPPASGQAAAMDDDERDRRENALKAWKGSGVPARYAKADFATITPAILDVRGESKVTYGGAVVCLRALLDKPGIVALLGTRGTGKTWMACGLIREFCRKARFSLYRDAMDYFLELKSTYDNNSRQTQEQVEGRYLRPQLLVLDEVHERGDTAWEDRMLTRLINKRYAAQLSTVLVANQDPDTFEQRVGTSIHDRIFDDGGIIVCDWPSLRGRVP